MTEEETKQCGKCETEIIHVKIIKEWNGKKEEKLQWQNVEDKKPHFMYAGPNKYNCKMPQTQEEQIVAEVESHLDLGPGIDLTVKVTSPFEEAELLARWATEKAYKIAMADVESVSQLSPQQVSALGQKQGMLTRLLVDTTIELMKMHNIKSNYETEN